MRGNSRNYQRKYGSTPGFDLCGGAAALIHGVMRFFAIAVLLVVGAGCEKQLSPEEAEQKREAEMAARPTPTPKPGAWMKDAKSPLDKKPTR